MPSTTMPIIRSVVNPDNPSVLLSAIEGASAASQAEAFGHWHNDLLSSSQISSLIAAAKSVCYIRMLNPDTQKTVNLGTGFLVAPNHIMTNRHVAEYFCTKHGVIDKYPAHAIFDNDGTSSGNSLKISDVAAWGKDFPSLKVFAYDAVILQIESPVGWQLPAPLTFAATTGFHGAIAAIGFPTNFDALEAGKPKPYEDQKLVFGESANGEIAPEKRISPAIATPADMRTRGLVHQCSTLPGNSGSPVIDVETGHVIALHFLGWKNGIDEKYNVAIPAAALRDMLVHLKSVEASTPGIVDLVTGRSRRRRTLVSRDDFGVVKDVPDFRDLPYRPGLAALPPRFAADRKFPCTVLHQQDTAACTGFALVHAIAVMSRTTQPATMLSPRMAYEMARIHDDIPGRDTEGSSLRGVVKGYFHNGLAPDPETAGQKRKAARAVLNWDKPWQLDLDIAEAARRNALGAYYRLSPNITDYHAALVETGAILVSAKVHDGWRAPQKLKARTAGKARTQARGTIVHDGRAGSAAHAFVIVGYDETGFIVLNSYGPGWGRFRGAPGRAHWSYEDWAENVIDGWVMRPAVPAPTVFGRQVKSAIPTSWPLSIPRRSETIGHVLMTDQGLLQDFGRSATSLRAAYQTSKVLAKRREDKSLKYQHLLVVSHAETTSDEEVLIWSSATKAFFKANGIYPLSLSCDPEHAVAFNDLLASAHKEALQRLPPEAPGFDNLVSLILQKFGPQLWRSYRSAQHRATRKQMHFQLSLRLMLRSAARAGLKLHAAGHLAGAHLLALSLGAEDASREQVHTDSLHLIGAALNWPEYETLISTASKSGEVRAFNYCFDRTSGSNRLRAPSTKWLSLLESAIAVRANRKGQHERQFFTGFSDAARLANDAGARKIIDIGAVISDKSDVTRAIWDSGLLNVLAENILGKKPEHRMEKLPFPPALLVQG